MAFYGCGVHREFDEKNCTWKKVPADTLRGRECILPHTPEKEKSVTAVLDPTPPIVQLETSSLSDLFGG